MSELRAHGLVQLVCACGRTFLATERGVRAGRRWCTGKCQDEHKPFNYRRVQYMREYGRNRVKRGAEA